MVFIDAANILYSQKTLGWKVGYENLKNYLDYEVDLISVDLIKIAKYIDIKKLRKYIEYLPNQKGTEVPFEV